jgi:hypothetical protein
MQFVIIANRQINRNIILAAEGCSPGQSGKVKLYLQPLAAAFLSGAPGVTYEPPQQPTEAATVILDATESKLFREQWKQAQLTMTAGQ